MSKRCLPNAELDVGEGVGEPGAEVEALRKAVMETADEVE